MNNKIIFLLVLFCFILSLFSYAQEQNKDTAAQKNIAVDTAYAVKRRNMVEQYIIGYGMHDKKVIRAFLSVPRHEFVLPEYKAQAYEDKTLPIGQNQTTARPYVLAMMTELLKLEGQEKVLELGTGSGYHAAILSLLCKDVYTVDIQEEMKAKAEERIGRLKYPNIHFRLGEGTLGWPEEAPFDAIIVGFAADSIIPELIKQLKEGGRLVIPVENASGGQKLKMVLKKNGKVQTKDVIPVDFVSMIKTKSPAAVEIGNTTK
jgi:protein-L-isoaspartate(D-aspartate) O-methyltransferase